MFRDRRKLLLGLCFGVPFGLLAKTLAALSQGPEPQKPTDPSKNADPQLTDDVLTSPSATKSMLEANDKDIKKRVEKLYQLATELKAEVEKTDSIKVLSVAMVKKAEEIEKLAKEIKTRAKG